MGWIKGKRPPKIADETLPSTWEMPSFAKDERPDHPTPKPLDAFGIPMRQHVVRGGLCYEPFSGSGSQIMAGEATGRRVYALAIGPAYVDVAIERWQAETGKHATLNDGDQMFSKLKAQRLATTAPASAAFPTEVSYTGGGFTRSNGRRRNPTTALDPRLHSPFLELEFFPNLRCHQTN